VPSAVRDNPALSRFELDANGVTAVANYILDRNVMTLTHTETPEAARGGGIASRLIEGRAAHGARARLEDRAALLVRARLSRQASGVSRPPRLAGLSAGQLPRLSSRRVGPRLIDNINHTVVAVDLERELRDRPDTVLFCCFQENHACGLRAGHRKAQHRLSG
jgi:uncharacterized protein